MNKQRATILSRLFKQKILRFLLIRDWFKKRN